MIASKSYSTLRTTVLLRDIKYKLSSA